MSAPVLRRTLALEGDLDASREAGSQVILTGSATHDLFVDPSGRALPLPDLMRSWAQRRELGLVVYSIGSAPVSYDTLPDGARIPLPSFDADAQPADVLRGLAEALRDQERPAVLCFDYADLVVGVSHHLDFLLAVLTKTLQALTADTVTWQRRGLQLVVVDRGGGLHPRLASQPGFRQVALHSPDREEAALFLERKCAPTTRRPLVLEDGLGPDEAAGLGGGLQIRDFNELAATSSADRPVTRAHLAARKAEVIRQLSGGTLTMMDASVSFGEDVAGMASLRLLLEGTRAIGRSTVRIMLSGPPASGKTYVAAAIASWLGVPLVALGQILGELLGQAENNMIRALGILRAMAPVALFIDEADQGPLGRRDANGRTSNEAYQALRAMLFNFLSAPGEDNGISVIATTNVPARLDPAAQSRFEFLPTLFASAPDLAQIMLIFARRNGIPVEAPLEDVLGRYLSDRVAIDGRRAQRLVLRAWTNARLAGDDAVRAVHVQRALDRQIGHDWTPAAEYSTLTSLLQASSLDAMPWTAAAELGEDYPVPAHLTPYLTADHQLRTEVMRHRIAELEALGVY